MLRHHRVLVRTVPSLSMLSMILFKQVFTELISILRTAQPLLIQQPFKFV
nr:MAG TPA: hypothetical protein [Caudoviricetes sp.]